MKSPVLVIATLSCALALCATATASAQSFDIGSGGAPTLSGAQGGSVSGGMGATQDLVVTVMFGEVSPVNRNVVVKAVVPVAVRSTKPYQVSVSVSGAFGAGPRAVRASDIGFGVGNLRPLGAQAQACVPGAHSFRAPFENDPSNNVTPDSNGRAAYPSSLADVGVSTVILSGPKLTQGEDGGAVAEAGDSGYVFDVVLAIKPQFYASGTFSATLTFTISEGPLAPC